ncbi:MAG: hypothetical protein JSV33_02785 [bacterium]|nr:MAG: hypothetical protein JSV33_02785 [bacterium]
MKHPLRIGTVFILTLVLLNCSDYTIINKNGHLDEPDNVVGDRDIDQIHFTQSPPISLQRDPVSVRDGEIYKDILALTVSYGGGCGDHEFKLFVIPAFMESYPVQINLFFQHTNIDDSCEALISETFFFDIRRIADLYASQYGGYDDIILNIYGYFEVEPDHEDRIRVTYSPLP